MEAPRPPLGSASMSVHGSFGIQTQELKPLNYCPLFNESLAPHVLQLCRNTLIGQSHKPSSSVIARFCHKSDFWRFFRLCRYSRPCPSIARMQSLPKVDPEVSSMASRRGKGSGSHVETARQKEVEAGSSDSSAARCQFQCPLHEFTSSSLGN